MNRRFLLVDADGETILATLTMSAEEAALAVSEDQVLLAIDPEADEGALISDAVFKVSLTGGAPALVPRDPAFTGDMPGSVHLSQMAI